ncbi:MAG: hypothetical protein ACI93P_002292 [bacterium]|jgi:hypothetical protein
MGYKISPKVLEGLFDHIGNCELKVSEKRYLLIGSFVPKQFSGTVDHSGKIKLTVSKRSWELFGNLNSTNKYLIQLTEIIRKENFMLKKLSHLNLTFISILAK